MASYDWITISKPADYDRLETLLDPAFAPKSIARSLKGSISPAVQGVLIEHGYVDKDYRSTYYHFYSKKGRSYRSDCVRLHFFDGQVSFEAKLIDLRCTDDRPSDHYFGYAVIRPTIIATMGRSILSPDIRQGAKGLAIQGSHAVHLLGHKLKTYGFPSMAQHTDIAVCAHVSCWSILRHYSERFPQFREHLIYEITKMARTFDPGGLTPSLGFSVLQAEKIFQAAYCFPVLVSKKATGPDKFLGQLLAYLESGFPLFVAMGGKGHAIVAVGYDWRSDPATPSLNAHASTRLDSILAVDDNLLPYSCVPQAAGGDYCLDDFTSFIVPLPEKIYYPADAVDRQSTQLHKSLATMMVLPPEGDLIRRYYVTTISALRRHARENSSQLGEVLVGAVMRLQTAQFVWVVEYATAQQWNDGHVAARAILDATASIHDAVPVWLVHDEQTALFFERDGSGAKASVVKLNRPAGVPLGRMEQNLRPVRSRP